MNPLFHTPPLAALALAAACLTAPAFSEEAITGMIGVGTWATRAEFKDIRVTKDGEVLFASDFSKGLGPWKTHRGDWQVVDGALRQTGDGDDCRALAGDPSWSNYTLTLKARKLGGNEGFLVMFGIPDAASDVKSWWNIGGWRNSGHAIQSPGIWERRIRGNIETGRWYDIKVELDGVTVRTYLDGALVQTETKPTAANATRDFGRALIPDLIADPSVAEFDGTFYLYGTTDGMGQGLATAGLPVVWKSRDFLNWSFSGSIFADNFDAKYWAPSAPVLKDGRFYLFPTLDNRITVVVADSPEGPFRTLDGRDITKSSGWKQLPIDVGHPIDADVFLDRDGSYYMTWSQRFIARMKPDFSGFDGEPVEIRTKRGGYSEGPQIIARDDIRYYLYTLEGHENYKYAYMMTRGSLTDPWEAPEHDIIAETDTDAGIYGPGHGCFFRPEHSPQWYFLHLEYGRGSANRQVFAQKMLFNPDGTIQPVELTSRGVGALRPDPAYSSPNLAIGARADASSTAPDFRVPPRNDPRLNRIEQYSAANAIDGSNGSRWMAAAGDERPSLRIDLGQARPIDRTELYFVRPTAGHAYLVESSLDGRSWRRSGGSDEVRIRSPHVDEPRVTARYLRVTILRGEAGVWEFRAY